MLSTVNLDFDVADKKYIPHLQTFINQRKWEMMDTSKDLNHNPIKNLTGEKNEYDLSW